MGNKPHHICIFTQSHLSRAPRVVKEANVYAQAGYNVTVYATWHNQHLLNTDRSLLHSNVTYKAGADLLNWNDVLPTYIRFKRMVARSLVNYFGIQTKTALGYDFEGYLKNLLSENADMYIGHQEMGMALAKSLIEKGKKVAFDFEDWHSKDLLPKDRVYRPIKLLEQLEHFLLQNAIYTYTTSEAMAKALSEFHGTKAPHVVYNSFYASDREQMDGKKMDLQHHHTPSVYWFSQVIGKGRGLELLFEALPLVQTPFQLHLRGSIDALYKLELQDKTPEHVELYIHELVPPETLISRIAEHDLGIAFEETEPESRNYTITNKVFHYLQSGIPILATKTGGQEEVANKAPQAIILTERSPKQIAVAMDLILSNCTKVQRMKQASWNAGIDVFAFELIKDKLLQMVHTDTIT